MESRRASDVRHSDRQLFTASLAATHKTRGGACVACVAYMGCAPPSATNRWRTWRLPATARAQTRHVRQAHTQPRTFCCDHTLPPLPLARHSSLRASRPRAQPPACTAAARARARPRFARLPPRPKSEVPGAPRQRRAACARACVQARRAGATRALVGLRRGGGREGGGGERAGQPCPRAARSPVRGQVTRCAQPPAPPRPPRRCFPPLPPLPSSPAHGWVGDRPHTGQGPARRRGARPLSAAAAGMGSCPLVAWRAAFLLMWTWV